MALKDVQSTVVLLGHSHMLAIGSGAASVMFGWYFRMYMVLWWWQHSHILLYSLVESIMPVAVEDVQSGVVLSVV